MGCWWFLSSLREVSLPGQRLSSHPRDILYISLLIKHIVDKEPHSGSAATKSSFAFYTQLLK